MKGTVIVVCVLLLETIMCSLYCSPLCQLYNNYHSKSLHLCVQRRGKRSSSELGDGGEGAPCGVRGTYRLCLYTYGE